MIIVLPNSWWKYHYEMMSGNVDYHLADEYLDFFKGLSVSFHEPKFRDYTDADDAQPGMLNITMRQMSFGNVLFMNEEDAVMFKLKHGERLAADWAKVWPN